MSEETSNSGLQDRPGGVPYRRRRWLFAAFIGIAAVLGFAAGKVHSSPWLHWAGHHHPFDADEINFIVQHRIGRALSNADATPEQRDKINAIAKAAVNDVMAMRKDRSGLREKVLTIMKADTIDRSALEALRAEQFNSADAASKRILQAVGDAAEVLTPEQRRKLAEGWEQWHMHP
ncbi:MAG: Spy/CpxP family protein refolding chaperone [Rhodomicrobium sp.]